MRPSLRFALVLALSCAAHAASAQVPVRPSGVTVVDFDGIGAAPDAELPDGVRVATLPDVRADGGFAAASERTQHRGGNLLDSLAAAGAYNFGSGDPASARDRAVGFVLGEGAGTGLLFVQCVNQTGQPLDRITFGYSSEKYRRGAGPDGAAVSLERVSLVSLDGETFSSGGGMGIYGTSDATRGYEDAPVQSGSSYSSSKTLPGPVPPGGLFYVAFRFSVSEGESAADLPAFAIDDLYVGPRNASFDLFFVSRLEREFGEAPVGSTAGPMELAVHAVPSESVPTDIVVTGKHAGDFSVTFDYEFFGTSYYEVTFAPTGLGPRTAEVTFSDGQATSKRVALWGTGATATAGEGSPSDGAVDGAAPLRISRVYPNPSAGPLRVALASRDGGAVRLELLDVLGRVVRERSVAVAAGGAEEAVALDVSGLAAGAYALRASAGEATAYHAVTVTR